jgi:hypothetical protein
VYFCYQSSDVITIMVIVHQYYLRVSEPRRSRSFRSKCLFSHASLVIKRVTHTYYGIRMSLTIQHLHPPGHLDLFSHPYMFNVHSLMPARQRYRLSHAFPPPSPAIIYPCRCLCRGLALHRIYTFPFRLTLRHCRHIFLTADRTFIPRNCCAIEIVDGRT